MGEAKRRGTREERVAAAKMQAEEERTRLAAIMPSQRRRGERRHLELVVALAAVAALL